jgi:2-polyprenyl-6-methoxyphenol hydroxylase-like FAD-dependent oxidoreductase
MRSVSVNSALVIGGGIGGLTAAIALRRKGIAVHIIERDPEWSVYGVGIIQQANVIRAVAGLGLLDAYLDAGFPFDALEICSADGKCVRVPSPRLTAGYPANLGISRRALHEVLSDRTRASGATIQLGLTAERFEEDGSGVDVTFTDGTRGRWDFVVGADGLYSQTRRMIFPNASEPRFVGQSVWRHNFPRPAELTAMRVYQTSKGVGLVPISRETMYMYLTTPEPGNPRYSREELARTLRAKLADTPQPTRQLGEQIIHDSAVVYKPLEVLFLHENWHKGRVVLLGDAVHAATPHLGQGAGMAIEDSLVLAEEVARASTPEAAFTAYRARRFERCRFIVEASLAICEAQISGRSVDQTAAAREMFEVVAQPI